MRAQLTMQSFITGQLLIQIDFHPGTPVSLKGLHPGQIEIPTIPSTGERLSQALGDLDFKAIEQHLMSVLASVDRLVSSPEMTSAIKALKETLQEAGKLLARVDRQVEPLAGDLKKSVSEIGKLARNADAKLGPLEAGLDKTMSSARRVISEDSPLMVGLSDTLKELAAMSRSLRQLADYLEQHPETLVRGKPGPGGK
jgi:paraquat-inducible protein B